MLATEDGLLKTSKDQLIKDYYNGKTVSCLCHITDSLLLVGFIRDGLIIWDQQKEEEICQIIDYSLDSIKRVINTDNFIIKTKFKNELKLLTIRNMESKKFNIQNLLEVKDNGNYTESLQV